MKKLLILFTVMVLLTGCEGDGMAFQIGVVVKSETNDTNGYKYRVKVRNIAKKGICTGHYVLLTDENYRVGDTIIIR